MVPPPLASAPFWTWAHDRMFANPLGGGTIRGTVPAFLPRRKLAGRPGEGAATLVAATPVRGTILGADARSMHHESQSGGDTILGAGRRPRVDATRGRPPAHFRAARPCDLTVVRRPAAVTSRVLPCRLHSASAVETVAAAVLGPAACDDAKKDCGGVGRGLGRAHHAAISPPALDVRACQGYGCARTSHLHAS